MNNLDFLDSDTTKYDESHGSPFDRGSADSYYRRSPNPHYWPYGSYNGSRVDQSDMSNSQVEAYYAGYEDNDQLGCFKEY